MDTIFLAETQLKLSHILEFFSIYSYKQITAKPKIAPSVLA